MATKNSSVQKVHLKFSELARCVGGPQLHVDRPKLVRQIVSDVRDQFPALSRSERRAMARRTAKVVAREFQAEIEKKKAEATSPIILPSGFQR